jgi:hypothetical protein
VCHHRMMQYLDGRVDCNAESVQMLITQSLQLRSASTKTIFGDYPANLKLIFFRLNSADALKIAFPTILLPAKMILSTFMCIDKADPAVALKPK